MGTFVTLRYRGKSPAFSARLNRTVCHGDVIPNLTRRTVEFLMNENEDHWEIVPQTKGDELT